MNFLVSLTAFVAVFVVVSTCVEADTATGDHQPDDNEFGRWRTCLSSKLPADKKSTMERCVRKPGGTDMSKFRRGLGCVLESYGVVRDHKVDLKKMSSTASSVRSTELKKAFQDCPKDEKNASLDRTIKCVIDHLETSCPVVKQKH